MIRLAVVDDQADYRFGLCALLATIPGIAVVCEAEDGRAALAACERFAPDLVLLDIRMPGLDGIAVARELLSRRPSLRILMLTTFQDERLVAAALAAGAAGYALKDTPIDDLGVLIRMTMKGYATFSPSIRLAAGGRTARAIDPELDARIASLTKRERSILHAIAKGSTNRDIAAELYLSEGTVKNYVTKILERLGVRSRTEAALSILRHEMNVGLVGCGNDA